MAENNIVIDKKTPFYISRPVILVTCLAYWPVAIFLMALRVFINKRDRKMMGHFLQFVVFLCVGTGIMTAIDFYFKGRDPDEITIMIFLAAVSIVCFILSLILVKSGLKHRKYVYFITNKRMTSLEEIAEKMECNVETARKDIQHMIKNGFLADGYIDDNTNEIIIPSLPEKPELPKEEFECKSCGASVMIAEDEDKVCEYCGSELDKKEVS